MTTIQERFDRILDLQNREYPEKTPDIITSTDIEEMEVLLGKKIPENITAFWDILGKKGLINQVVIGGKICSSKDILGYLHNAQSFVKPKNPKTISKEEEMVIIARLNPIIATLTPKPSLSGLIQQKWDKIALRASPNSLSGPYLYTNNEEIILKKDNLLEEITNIIKILAEKERDIYNWDEVELEFFPNGEYHIERKYWDFHTDIITSHPINAIKKLYTHTHWIPLWSDGGGNYIGVDMDPDTKGTLGQIINFGRDEEAMYVFGDTLESFLDVVIMLFESEKFDTDIHFIDLFKEHSPHK